jgi:hypothetical protein
MNVLLRIANGQDCCVTLLLACLMAYTGGFLVQGRPSVWRGGWAVCGVVAVADFAYLCRAGGVTNVPQLFGAVVTAMIAGYLACGVGWIAFGSLSAFCEHVVVPLEERIRAKLEQDRFLAEIAREAARREKADQERKRAEEAERERIRNLPPPPPKPPPPPRSDRVKAEMERHAAELAEAMKEPDEDLRDVLTAGLAEEHRQRLQEIYRS